MQELLFGSATAMAAAIRARDVSVVEVVEAHIARIEAVNASLNAVVQTAFERAREEAVLADAALKSRHAVGPLHGVPITLKDSIDTEGIITTYGTWGRRKMIPMCDATVAARLRAAGAIVLGKTNTPEFTLGGEIDNPVYGKTFNPYRLTHSPGSSSGGAAAIVAAGGAALDLGSDTGGSIREPANMCGLAGIKPTAGRVSRMGHAIPFGCGAGDMLTTIGPLARSVDDLELSLELIAGPDGIDYTVVPMAWRESTDIRPANLRIAMYTDGGLCPINPAIETAIHNAAAVFANEGAIITEATPPALNRAARLHRWLSYAEQAQYLWQEIKKAGTAEAEIGPNLNSVLEAAKAADMPNMTTILTEFASVRTDAWQWMQAYDAILCPIEPYVALPHGQVLTFDADMLAGWAHMGFYNITGWPAGVVRVGTTEDGLPVGVQIVGKPWREDVVLALMRVLEQAFGYQRPVSAAS